MIDIDLTGSLNWKTAATIAADAAPHPPGKGRSPVHAIAGDATTTGDASVVGVAMGVGNPSEGETAGDGALAAPHPATNATRTTRPRALISVRRRAPTNSFVNESRAAAS